MICPRCQLPNPRTTLVCARCGELTPHPNRSPFETRPPEDGPRFSPLLAREVGLDRRGRGVRAMNVPVMTPPPVRVRPAPPQWARAPKDTPRPQRVVAAAELAQPERLAPVVPLPSVVHQARTEPNWHREPEPEPVVLAPAPVEAPAPVLASAPLKRRVYAGLIDVGVVLSTAAFAAILGVVALGPSRLAPHFDHGFDFVLDGVLVGRGIGLLGVALTLVLGFAYVTLAHALGGATLGKALCGLRLVGPGDEPLTLAESTWRTVGCGLSAALGFAGFAFAAFDGSRRALHDVLVGTRVVDLRAPDTDTDTDTADLDVDLAEAADVP